MKFSDSPLAKRVKEVVDFKFKLYNNLMKAKTMKTEIINTTQSFSPVTLQMTFETEDELAVFLSVMGNSIKVSSAVFCNLDSIPTINSFIKTEDWMTLRKLVRGNKLAAFN